MNLLRRIRRRMIRRDMADTVLDTIALLERAGCQVQGAAILPMPSIHINRPPADCHTCGYVEPSPLVRRLRLPVPHYAYLDGVRITWLATPKTPETHHV